jgi:uncharacterized protein (DUF2062 family)
MLPMLKRVLRYLPRRATLHKYPVIGRFAAHLRPRDYLWSFRRQHLRRAYYAGSIIALLPLFGIQLPLALVAALLLRSNFVVLGGLQLITNPLTAAPIYYATHQLGSAVTDRFWTAAPAERVSEESELTTLGGYVVESIAEPLTSGSPRVKWTVRARNAVAAMGIGGGIAGLCIGALLDLADVLARRTAWRSKRRAGRAP